MRYLLLLLLMGLGPGAAPASRPDQSIEEKSQSLLTRWRPRLEQEHLNYLVSAPYVIAGDGPRRQLEAYRDRTILAATRALQASFFENKPTEPILILLFESAEPYQRLSKQWFGRVPDTPFGYFRRDGVMVMNVGTGTGTLVHELVHALIKPDFPNVPDWFNEGLGSLYEQSSIDGEKVRGLPNWRLSALQRAIGQNKLRSLRALTEDDDFYGHEHVGLNYAQARYLLLYLQETDRLEQFYRKLKSNQKKDPTGLATLAALLGPQKLDEFERQWRKWVLALRFD